MLAIHDDSSGVKFSAFEVLGKAANGIKFVDLPMSAEAADKDDKSGKIREYPLP